MNRQVVVCGMFVARTNILERYYNEDVRLTLPEGKRISRIKWLAIYDISSQVRLQSNVNTYSLNMLGQ